MDSIEVRERRELQEQAEAEGRVADSMDVRTALIAKLDAGEMTLGQVQAELARIKRGAKAAGKITRTQAWHGR